MKYIKISIVILLVSFISIFAYKLTTNNSSNKISLTKEQMKEMLSYTIDGNKTSFMPTKGSGYKVKSITCKSGSILTWDNDNWLLEVEKLESEDLCNIDFTTGTGSYTVTAVPSISGSLDSTSKTTTENGQVTFYTDAIIDSVSGCTNEISDGKVVVKNVTSNSTCNINVSYIKLYDRLLTDNPTIKTRTDFSTPFTTNTANTLYKAQEDNTDVYYFAGQDTASTPINNWVILGEYYGKLYLYRRYTDDYQSYTDYSSLEDCQKYGDNCEEEVIAFEGEDIYWRIIRTNSDGSIRLLYSGTSPDTTSGYIGISEFNENRNSPKYVGYMYGDSDTTLEEARTNTNDSTIKTFVDTWYENNFTAYTNYLSNDAVYCNDRELASGKTYSTSTSFTFKSSERLITNKTPTYDCTNKKDAFSVNNNEAKLKYPIALMTADESLYAGINLDGKYDNSSLWLNTNSAYELISKKSWWTMSSSGLSDQRAYQYFAEGDSWVSAQYYIRPVINLKSCVQWKSGDGSASDPYTIKETETGC